MVDMMLLAQLFIVCLIIGFMAFGGGYAMIPLVHDFVVDRFGWMGTQEFTDMIAIAGMAPGPIAVNSATLIGFHQAGILGTLTAVIGMVLPSLLIALIIVYMVKRFGDRQNKWLHSAFDGLKPAITGLIIYSALVMAINNGLTQTWDSHSSSQMLIFLASLMALLFLRIHPVYIILASGVVGIVLYS